MTTMRLSYIPIPASHHVYLNGIEQREGTDWSDDGTGLLTFASAMDIRSTDKIEVLYAHNGLVNPLLPGDYITSAGQGSFTGGSVGSPSLSHGSSAVVFSAVVANGVPSTPAGWNLAYASTALPGSGVYLTIFWRNGDPSGTTPGWTGSVGGFTWYIGITWAYDDTNFQSASGHVGAAGGSHTTPGAGGTTGRTVHVYTHASSFNPVVGATERFEANVGGSYYIGLADIIGDPDPITITSPDTASAWASATIGLG